ncbi:MAG: hypothetical protein LBT59_30195 [Clostridiales bacterium]|nr:hypothetical protein [Clostridiales bacterium]
MKNKKNKKTWLLAVIAIFAMSLSACSGNNAATPTPIPTQTPAPVATPEPATPEPPPAEPANTEVKLTDGVFECLNPDLPQPTYYKFKEDGTYYGRFFSGGVIEAGTYAVLDESKEYSVDAGADADFATLEDNAKATADQVIEVTSFSGTVQKMAFANDTLLDVALGSMSSHQNCEHNPSFPYDEDDETPIVVEIFYADNLEGSSVTLYHSKTFVDYTGDIGEEGKWEKTGDNSYSLVSDDTGATYTLTKDGSLAAYDKNGETLELNSVIISADTPMTTLSAKDAQVGLPMGVDVNLELYKDGTAKLLVYVAAVDATLEADTATYVQEEGNYILTFEKAGTINSTGGTLVYSGESTVDSGGTEMPLTFDNLELAGEFVEAGATLLITFEAKDQQVGLPMGVDLKIECYSDNTAKLLVYVAAVDATLEADAGTYGVADVFNFTFKFEKAGDIASVPDYASATPTSIAASVPYKGDVSVDFAGNSTPLSIDASLLGTVTVG